MNQTKEEWTNEINAMFYDKVIAEPDPGKIIELIKIYKQTFQELDRHFQ